MKLQQAGNLAREDPSQGFPYSGGTAQEFNLFPYYSDLDRTLVATI